MPLSEEMLLPGRTVKLNQPIMLDGRVITTLVSQIQYSNGQASMRNLGIS